MAKLASIVDRALGACRRRGPVAVLVVCLPLVACLLAPASSIAAECGNEAIREQQSSTFLPECRAYELVSPSEAMPEMSVSNYAEHANLYLPLTAYVLAGSEAPAISYQSLYPDAEAASDGVWFLSKRESSGWSTASVVPPQSTSSNEELGHGCAPAVYFAENLMEHVLADGGRYYTSPQGYRPPCQVDEPPLVAGEPEGGFRNLFMSGAAPGAYRLVNVTPAGVAAKNAFLEDVSEDFTHVLFVSTAALVPGAPAGPNLYEWAGGAVRLVSYLPNGSPVQGRLAGGETPPTEGGHATSNPQPSTAPIVHGASSDGERVYFSAEVEGGRNLYLREHAMQSPTVSGGCAASEPDGACTVQVDAKEGGPEEGGGVFLYASADDSRVFFTDERRLTGSATASRGNPELYEYDLQAPEGHRLKDLTVDASEPADVLGLSGASQDGAYIYFVADAALTGSEEDSVGAVAQRKQPNLYVDHEGSLSFIATLSQAEDKSEWASEAPAMWHTNTATAPSGLFFAFESVARIGKYVNTPAKSGDCTKGLGSEVGQSAPTCSEVYLYSAAARGLVCASCSPEGARPTGPSGITDGETNGSLPPMRARRWLLEDGTLFFESTAELVPQANDGATNVYEYTHGEAHLISDGLAGSASVFAEASPNGEDVYFIAPNSLVSSDTGSTNSLYDARVEGGFAAQSAPLVEGEECGSAKACRATVGEPPVEAFGASSAFTGAGDLTPVETTLQEPTPAGKAKQGGKHRLTRAQKLKRALKACLRRRRSKARQRCRRRARHRFRAHAKHRPEHRHGRRRRHGHARKPRRQRKGTGRR